MEHRHHGGGIPPGLHHTIFSLSVLPACRDSKAAMFESSIAQMKEFRATFSFTNRFPVIPAKFRLRPSIAMPDKLQPNGCFGNLSRFPKSLSSTFSALPIFVPRCFQIRSGSWVRLSSAPRAFSHVWPLQVCRSAILRTLQKVQRVGQQTRVLQVRNNDLSIWRGS